MGESETDDECSRVGGRSHGGADVQENTSSVPSPVIERELC